MWYKQNAAHNNKYQINTLIRNCCRIITCHVTVVNYKTVEWVMFHTYLIRLFVLAAMKWKPEAIVRDSLVGDSNSWRGCVVVGAGESEREDPFNDRHQKETTIRLSLSFYPLLFIVHSRLSSSLSTDSKTLAKPLNIPYYDNNFYSKPSQCGWLFITIDNRPIINLKLNTSLLFTKMARLGV